MSRRSETGRQRAERTFPWRVDVPVPELGLQERLPAMLGWCERRFGGLEGWDQHGITVGRDPTGIPIDAARFYFSADADARAFLEAWGGILSAAL